MLKKKNAIFGYLKRFFKNLFCYKSEPDLSHYWNIDLTIDSRACEYTRLLGPGGAAFSEQNEIYSKS